MCGEDAMDVLNSNQPPQNRMLGPVANVAAPQRRGENTIRGKHRGTNLSHAPTFEHAAGK
jgi:hypothetical protein